MHAVMCRAMVLGVRFSMQVACDDQISSPSHHLWVTGDTLKFSEPHSLLCLKKATYLVSRRAATACLSIPPGVCDDSGL